ncbi:MAG: nucleoside monophosphate kinase [Bacilli bacterium]
MKNIILYGAPAAGKGTQCEMLKNRYGYKHISMGQIFRDLDDSTDFNRKIHDMINAGILIDDVTTTELLKNKLGDLKVGPIVLDGFPRNLNQAKLLDEFFSDYIVINLDINEDIALKRALGRLNCSSCGKIYNIYFQDTAPIVADKCDVCGATLVGRKDDNEESFKNRFNIYLDNVKDILDYYEDKNILYRVNSENAEKTFLEVEKILNGGDY